VNFAAITMGFIFTNASTTATVTSLGVLKLMKAQYRRRKSPVEDDNQIWSSLIVPEEVMK
jgi:hypothetical protein